MRAAPVRGRWKVLHAYYCAFRRQLSRARGRSPGFGTASDVALVQASLRGDRAALALLYKRYADALRTLARMMLGDGADAEDVLHDVFVESWQKLASFDATRGSVRIWLLVRLRSRVIDRLGSHHRRRLVPLVDEATEPAHCAGSDPPAVKYLATVVRRGCATLPAAQRQLLDSLYVYDMTLAEIAAEQRVPVGTIKSRLNRVLRLLRREKV